MVARSVFKRLSGINATHDGRAAGALKRASIPVSTSWFVAVVVLVLANGRFWATWCPPCRREMPALQKTALERPDATIVPINQGEYA